jgi:hypothetical protein
MASIQNKLRPYSFAINFYLQHESLTLWLYISKKQMKSSIKNISRNNWSYLIPQITIFLAFALLLKELEVTQYWLLSASLYLLLSTYVKIIIPKWHRKGLFYLRKGELEGAIYAFETSYIFFKKYSWLDTYRAFTLLSLSWYSYREMALMNIIYCYSHLGKEKEAREVQKRLSIEFPSNVYGKRK